MGYTLSEEDARKPYVEVSGRKGLGVKADDLLDRLEAAARAEVDPRHADAPEAERAAIAHCIAIGALRYFLLKFTRTAIIAFDFEDALSFDGETGPYCQYAVVRARNIFRKLADQQPDFRTETLDEPGDAASLAETAEITGWRRPLGSGTARRFARLQRYRRSRRAGASLHSQVRLRAFTSLQPLLSPPSHPVGRRLLPENCSCCA